MFILKKYVIYSAEYIYLIIISVLWCLIQEIDVSLPIVMNLAALY